MQLLQTKLEPLEHHPILGLLGFSETELHVGYNAHRLKRLPDGYHDKEIKFVHMMNEEIRKNKDLLAQIVNKRKPATLTEDEEKIAMSVIQWLGTPVGQKFLSKVEKTY